MQVIPEALKQIVEPGVIEVMDKQDSGRGAVATPASTGKSKLTHPLVVLSGMAAGLLVWTWAAFMPVCDMMFACGCTWPWAGGNESCNMHMAGMIECPWCSQGPVFHDALAAVIFGAGLAVSGWALLRRRSMMFAFVCGIGGWLVAALLLGILMALVDGYPTFLGLSI